MKKELGNIRVENSGNVYFINKKEYPIEELTFCHQSGEYVITEMFKSKLIKGVVQIAEDGFTLVMGSFIPTLSNVYLNYSFKKKSPLQKQVAINRNIFNIGSNPYFEENARGEIVFTPSTPTHTLFNKVNVSSDMKTRLPYSVTTNEIKPMREYLDNVKFKSTTLSKAFANILQGRSFGVEFETSRGVIPTDQQMLSGLVPLRDGSIDGYEYVTIPLQGEQGVHVLLNAVNVISKYTETNAKCALHYHIGEIPRTEEFIVALWYVISNIQLDLFEMQPPYKVLNYGFKKKSYAKPLPAYVSNKLSPSNSVRQNFEIIFDYLSMGRSYKEFGESLDNVSSHPSDPNGSQKWNVAPRYAVVNFIPLIFGNKKTVEFRHNEISTNPNLIINELILNASIVNYVIKNTEFILKNPGHAQHRTIENLVLGSMTDSNLSSRMIDFLQVKRTIVAHNFRDRQLFMNFNTKISNIFRSSDLVSVKGDINPKFAVSFIEKNSRLRTVTGTPMNMSFLDMDLRQITERLQVRGTRDEVVPVIGNMTGSISLLGSTILNFNPYLGFTVTNYDNILFDGTVLISNTDINSMMYQICRICNIDRAIVDRYLETSNSRDVNNKLQIFLDFVAASNSNERLGTVVSEILEQLNNDSNGRFRISIDRRIGFNIQNQNGLLDIIQGMDRLRLVLLIMLKLEPLSKTLQSEVVEDEEIDEDGNSNTYASITTHIDGDIALPGMYRKLRDMMIHSNYLLTEIETPVFRTAPPINPAMGQSLVAMESFNFSMLLYRRFADVFLENLLSVKSSMGTDAAKIVYYNEDEEIVEPFEL